MKTDPAIALAVRKLELRARRALGAHVSGAYRSAFRGRGLLYADSREYQPGDDIRYVNWKASARSSKVFVKTYEEERRLRVMLVVDASASVAFAGKHERARSFASLVAALAQRNKDSLGLCTFSDRVHDFISPRPSRSQFHHIASRLVGITPEGRPTALGLALDEAARRLPRHSVVFVISDFLAEDFHENLIRLSTKHDVVAALLSHPFDRELPGTDLIRFRGAEDDKQITYDTAAAVRGYDTYLTNLKALCRKARCDLVRVEHDPVVPLERLMLARARSRMRSVVLV